jgi:hypothetical protein
MAAGLSQMPSELLFAIASGSGVTYYLNSGVAAGAVSAMAIGILLYRGFAAMVREEARANVQVNQQVVPRSRLCRSGRQ